MSGSIIPLRGDGHNKVQALLPWYVCGRLDAGDRAEVEAHLAECLECQAELRIERRLSAEVATTPVAGASVAGGPGDVEHGWALMRRRIETGSSPRRPPVRWPSWLGAGGGSIALPWAAGPAWMRWALAGQFALLVAVTAYVTPILRHDQARYHALGAAPPAASANLVVIFRPDTTERDMRAILGVNHARLVDGPTTTDAYLLHVPAAERGAALDRLRRQPRIELAEPVDEPVVSGASP
jgi:hypothetical protein